MPRKLRNHVTPWIEELILSFGTQQEQEKGGADDVGGWLRAHVIGVGQMTPSQARGSADLTGLLFLSDGVLQIPAVLTSSAWECLQDEGDHESFTSILNTTMCLRDYTLRFHASTVQSRCRFFLCVGELTTVAVGQFNDSPPCSTSLNSVRMKIVQLWRKLLGQKVAAEEAEETPDLSELLGEWHHDCVAEVMVDVKRRLAVNRLRGGPHPSTPIRTPPPPPTGWELDRIKFKDQKQKFSVPVKCLLMPEEGALLLQSLSKCGRGSEPNTADSRGWTPEGKQASDDDSEWGAPAPPPADQVSSCAQNPVGRTEEVRRPGTERSLRVLSNPWDVFPPPCSTSSSNTSADALWTDDQPELDTRKSRLHLRRSGAPHASSDQVPGPSRSPGPSLKATQTDCHCTPVAAAPRPQSSPVTRLQNTRLPVHNTRSPVLASVRSREGDRSIPPYQRPPPGPPGLHLTPASSEPLSRPSAGGARIHSAAADQEGAPERSASKRKKSDDSGEGLEPPSWLFDSPSGLATKMESNRRRNSVSVRNTPRVHCCGRPFSYTYRASAQNLRDFGRFTVDDSLLRWAVRYLLSEDGGSTKAAAVAAEPD